MPKFIHVSGSCKSIPYKDSSTEYKKFKFVCENCLADGEIERMFQPAYTLCQSCGKTIYALDFKEVL